MNLVFISVDGRRRGHLGHDWHGRDEAWDTDPGRNAWLERVRERFAGSRPCAGLGAYLEMRQKKKRLQRRLRG